jgi:type IV secretory pathway VirB2 component (pilin)
MLRPAAGSAHHQPKAALAASPTSSTADRSARSEVWLASDTVARDPSGTSPVTVRDAWESHGSIGDMRGIRMIQVVLVGSAAVVGGLIGLATNVASAQRTPWPGPLRWIQDNPWGAMATLVGIAVVIAVVLERRSGAGSTDATPVSGQATGPVAGKEVSITGGLGDTAGRDATSVAGGAGQTAGHDIHITNVSVPSSTSARAGLKWRRIVTIAPDGTRTITDEIYSEEVAIQRIRQDSSALGPSIEDDGGENRHNNT